LPDPEERFAKAGFAIRGSGAIRARRLTKPRAAQILKIDQQKNLASLAWPAFGFFHPSGPCIS